MKKVKATLLTILLAAVAVAFTLHQFKPEPKYYEPYSTGQKQNANDYPDQGIAGAMEFWAERKANQLTGIVDPADVNAGIAEARQIARNKKGRLNWISMGPDNVGGRTRAFAIDRDNNKILYAGGVSSGFFKSTNQGLSWRKTDFTDNQIISTMIQTANGDIYFGTGEQFFGRQANGTGSSAFMGNGIYKSTDRGETFSHLSTTTATSSFSRWSNVNMLADDPRDAATFYAGTMDGLMKTEDGGQTFSQLFAPPSPFSTARVCSDLRVSPNGQTIFAVFQSSGQGAAHLYRSTDFGQSFTRVGSGTEIPVSLSRLVIAIAPSNPNIVYASAAKSGNHKLEKVYRSTDNGDTWESIGVGSSLFHPFSSFAAQQQGQGDYDNMIAVDPRNPNRIFLGGVGFYSWSTTQGWLHSAGLTYFSGSGRNDNYIHADKHNIVFDTTVNPYIMYVTTDGGIAKSTNAQNTVRPTFGTITKNYITTQFYSVAGSITGEAIGGTQDNGTIRVAEKGLNNKTGDDLIGGDGGYAAISKINPNVYFGETQYGNLIRSLDRGASGSEFWDTRSAQAFGEYGAPFVTPFDLWEDWHNTDTQLTRFVIGLGAGVWMTEEALVFSKTPVWYNITPGFNPPITINCIEISPDGDAVYFGSGARLYRITGLNDLDFATDCDSTTGNCGGANLKVDQIFNSGGQQVTGIGIDPSNPERLVLTLGNYGNSNYVYLTNNALDATVNFTNIHRNLPRVPVYDAIISANDPSVIVLGTEVGVYATYDATATTVSSWEDENGGDLDIVPVLMLSQVEQFPGEGPVVFIGTHGRGIFRAMELNTSVKPKPQFDANMNLYPNPVQGNTTLKYELPTATEVAFSIYDMNGKLIQVERLGKQPAGNHRKNINTTSLKNGIYIVTLSGDEFKSSVRMVVSE